MQRYGIIHRFLRKNALAGLPWLERFNSAGGQGYHCTMYNSEKTTENAEPTYNQTLLNKRWAAFFNGGR